MYKGCGNMKVIEPPGWTNVNDNFGADGTWANPVFSPGLSNVFWVLMTARVVMAVTVGKQYGLTQYVLQGSMLSGITTTWFVDQYQGSPTFGCTSQ